MCMNGTDLMTGGVNHGEGSCLPAQGEDDNDWRGRDRIQMEMATTGNRRDRVHPLANGMSLLCLQST